MEQNTQNKLHTYWESTVKSSPPMELNMKFQYITPLHNTTNDPKSNIFTAQVVTDTDCLSTVGSITYKASIITTKTCTCDWFMGRKFCNSKRNLYTTDLPWLYRKGNSSREKSQYAI